jgi:hypothetical protein
MKVAEPFPMKMGLNQGFIGFPGLFSNANNLFSPAYQRYSQQETLVFSCVGPVAERIIRVFIGKRDESISPVCNTQNMIRLGLESEDVGRTTLLTCLLVCSKSVRWVPARIVTVVPDGETDDIKLQEVQVPSVLVVP